MLADKIRFFLDDAPLHAKIGEINIHKEGIICKVDMMTRFLRQIKQTTTISVPIEYRQDAVRLYSSSGSWLNKHPASYVLYHSNTDEDNTGWVGTVYSSEMPDWFVLDLSAEMSFDAVKVANSKCPPYNDGYTKEFK